MVCSCDSRPARYGGSVPGPGLNGGKSDLASRESVRILIPTSHRIMLRRTVEARDALAEQPVSREISGISHLRPLCSPWRQVPGPNISHPSHFQCRPGSPTNVRAAESRHANRFDPRAPVGSSAAAIGAATVTAGLGRRSPSPRSAVRWEALARLRNDATTPLALPATESRPGGFARIGRLPP